jgi:PLP dependent protein
MSSDLTMHGFCAALETVQQRIRAAAEAAGRQPDEIQLIAVSKTNSSDRIAQVYGCNQRHFGENKVQELVPKMQEGAPDIVWHMIGTLQSNKVKYMIDRVDWIHSVPKFSTLQEIDRRAAGVRRTVNVLIQVNISEEDQKSGCDPADLEAFVLASRQLNHVKVRGLMGIASFDDNPELVRSQFRTLRLLRDAMANHNGGAVELTHLSMGMTHDLEIAIQEGATMVRVGSAIFGERHAT